MQEVQREQKVSLDQLSRQMSQLATSMYEMRGNEGKIPAQVPHPHCVNVIHITLRSGRELKMPDEPKGSREVAKESSQLGSSGVQNEKNWDEEFVQQVMEAPSPPPKEFDPLNLIHQGSSSGLEKKDATASSSKKPLKTDIKASIPFSGRLAKERPSEDPIEFISIFGKVKKDGKIVIGENVLAVIQKKTDFCRISSSIPTSWRKLIWKMQ